MHHWDENGRRDLMDEPAEIQMIHADIVGFVSEWLEAWEAERSSRST